MNSHHGSRMENTNFPNPGWVHQILLVDTTLPFVGRLPASSASYSLTSPPPPLGSACGHNEEQPMQLDQSVARIRQALRSEFRIRL